MSHLIAVVEMDEWPCYNDDLTDDDVLEALASDEFTRAVEAVAEET